MYVWRVSSAHTGGAVPARLEGPRRPVNYDIYAVRTGGASPHNHAKEEGQGKERGKELELERGARARAREREGMKDSASSSIVVFLSPSVAQRACQSQPISRSLVHVWMYTEGTPMQHYSRWTIQERTRRRRLGVWPGGE